MDPTTSFVAKNGLCPNNSDITTPCDWKSYNCLEDAECGRNQKCCDYGCSPICMGMQNEFLNITLLYQILYFYLLFLDNILIYDSLVSKAGLSSNNFGITLTCLFIIFILF